MRDFKRLIEDNFPNERLLFDEPMDKHTSFKIGGSADIFVMPESASEIDFLIKGCKEHSVPFCIIGNGTNLLVADKGIRGVVIQIYKEFGDIRVTSNKIEAGSGALLSAIAYEAIQNGLTGMEFAAGIPGTLGGALCMNAGAYGGEMKDIADSVTVYHNGGIKTYENNELGFAYRTSLIQKQDMCVLSAVISLKSGDRDKIKQKTQELNKSRSDKQPLNKPSAGSTFKRPEGDFAGRLIMDSGLRGMRIGGAAVSEKHCGFVVNEGGATAEDVLKLIAHIKKVVLEKYNVELIEEIKIIGDVT